MNVSNRWLSSDYAQSASSPTRNGSPTTEDSGKSPAGSGGFMSRLTLANPFLNVSHSAASTGHGAEIHIQDEEDYDIVSKQSTKRSPTHHHSAVAETTHAEASASKSTYASYISSYWNRNTAVKPSGTQDNAKANGKDDPEQQISLLMIKDKELKMREADLAEREKRGGKYPSTTPTTPPDRRKNFPVCWPVMYHNIDDEIPEQHRLTMRWVYTLFIFNMATLWGNVLAAFIMVITHADGVTTAGKDLGMGVVYAVFAPVAAFFSWYRPVYNAFMKNSSMYYFLFFIFNGIHLVFNIYMCIGVPGSGSASTINMITMFSTPNTVMAGIVCAGAMGAWLLSAVGFSVAYRYVYWSYRYAGHSLESARNEAMGKVAGSGAAGWALRSAW